MARALLAIARASPDVSEVLACTLPEPSASTRILTRLAFRWTGSVQGPEDGTVWRWALPLRG
jgi:RimJ/RimL family protein N-acetyltransferase